MDPTALGIHWKKQLWHRWKSLRNVPFRKSWFVGYDLEGNSYWEMVDHNNPHRLRRKVSLDKPYFHFSDFKPHPMWMQWLQFTRPTPPEIVDLLNDAKRRYHMKLLAEQADKKWKSVPLKSQGSDSGSDPRLQTAWGAPKPTVQEDQKEPSQPTYQPSAHEIDLQKVLMEVESRQKDQPKVVRDHLGQVKVEQTKK